MTHETNTNHMNHTNGSPSSYNIQVSSENTTYDQGYIYSKYTYQDTKVITQEGLFLVQPVSTEINFKLETKLPKLGVMLVGWCGNNGSTLTAALIAHKKNLSWQTKGGIQKPNYYGSLMMASTISLGKDETTGNPVYVPFHQVLPIIHPESLVLGGWDISSMNLADAADRACVLEPDLKHQLRQDLEILKPLPSIFNPDFIAANQSDRADHILKGTLYEQVETIRQNIRDFKTQHGLDKVIILWTANTERYADVITDVNDTADNLLKALKNGHSEISPSTAFAIASILESSPFINGSPQNTFVPGVIDLAIRKKVPIGGDDFKSGQTKLKSVLVDFLVSAGIKPIGITSYNHLGNNDGKNLSAPSQFRSKEISKSNVVDDMVSSNSILYKKNEMPDHVVVIKYVPSVGDSKRALDEYESEIFMGGRNTISIHNTCEDSLLASPLILDLVLLTELLSRVEVKIGESYEPLHPVLSHLSYLLKAPLVPSDTPVVNALFKQRLALENFFRALLGLPPQSEMGLEHRLLSGLPSYKMPIKKRKLI